VAFIDANKDDVVDGRRLGVEPICRILQVAPSTYYAARNRRLSVRAQRDRELEPRLVELWKANYEVYGSRKLWKAARRAGIDIGRDQTARLMRQAGICAALRSKRVRTTHRGQSAGRHPDLVKRQFRAEEPNRLWVTDLTFVASWAGVAYVCFIVDAFSRMIVGWRVAGDMRTPMVLDAIEMARWSRGLHHVGLRCHSDAGSQFTSIRYRERLAEIGAVPSIGSVGDSYDNALAETVNGYYKAELIRGPARTGPWKTVEEVELATLGWLHWHNTQRLHGYLGDRPPVEFEAPPHRHFGLVRTQASRNRGLSRFSGPVGGWEGGLGGVLPTDEHHRQRHQQKTETDYVYELDSHNRRDHTAKKRLAFSSTNHCRIPRGCTRRSWLAPGALSARPASGLERSPRARQRRAIGCGAPSPLRLRCHRAALRG
jgi:transposase InsO family protein